MTRGRSFHPFPARMAPDLALSTLGSLEPGSIVLDPMTGSGTVAQQAKALGLTAIAYDLDPLAVLISKVSTTFVEDQLMEREFDRFMALVGATNGEDIRLDWIDSDVRTSDFINFWFASAQRDALRAVAYCLSEGKDVIHPDVLDIIKVATSRMIVTKGSGASLARDASHSRPHRVATENDYDVLRGLRQSMAFLRRRLSTVVDHGSVCIKAGDARNLAELGNGSVDAVLTSPPYLNAIDYVRGQRLSLVWLGYKFGELSLVRSNSVGAERKLHERLSSDIVSIQSAMVSAEMLDQRHRGMIARYARDLKGILREISRVLKPRGCATFVVGDSCLRGTFVRNSDGVAKAAEIAGLSIIERWERDLPAQSRYLPTPTSGALSKRMRKEVILRVSKH